MTSEYYKGFVKALNTLDLLAVEKVAKALKAAKTVYVGGNGGSAAISNHLTCDLQKGAGLKVHSMSCNTPLITAIANDCEYRKIFVHQLIDQEVDQADIVLLISSSGKSPNIIEAAKYCSEYSIPLIGFTGFDGGQLKDWCNYSVHVDSYDYGHVEDAHSHVMHTIAHILKYSLTD